MANKVYTSINYGKDYKDLYLETLQNNNKHVKIPEEITALHDIPVWRDNAELRSIDFNNIKSLPAGICENCKNLETVRINALNGPIGNNAFLGASKIKNFILSPKCNITELGANCFAGLGADVADRERFIFDFRGSTFVSFKGFARAEKSEFDSAIMQTIITESKLAISNATIYLPETVAYFSSSPTNNWNNDVLGGCTNIDLYITGLNLIPLQKSDFVPRDAESHILVNYKSYGAYARASNWAALSNLCGFYESALGESLPDMDSEGYKIEWYSDKDCTHKITAGTGTETYCKKSDDNTRYCAKVTNSGSYLGTVDIINIATAEKYGFEDLIPLNTEVKIVPKPLVENNDLCVFMVNDEDCLESGEKIITITGNINIYVAYDKFALPPNPYWTISYSMLDEDAYTAKVAVTDSQLPDYLKSKKLVLPDYFIVEDKLIPVVELDIYSNNVPGVRLPKTLQIISRYYVYRDSEEILRLPDGVTILGDYCFSSQINRMRKIILPNSLKQIGNCIFGNGNWSSYFFSKSDNNKCIEYDGSIEDFEKIQFTSGSSWFTDTNCYGYYNGTKAYYYECLQFLRTKVKVRTINAAVHLFDANHNEVSLEELSAHASSTFYLIAESTSADYKNLQHIVIDGQALDLTNYNQGIEITFRNLLADELYHTISVIYNDGSNILFPDNLEDATIDEIKYASLISFKPATWAAGDLKTFYLNGRFYQTCLVDTTGKYTKTESNNVAKFTFQTTAPLETDQYHYLNVNNDYDNTVSNLASLHYLSTNNYFLTNTDQKLLAAIEAVTINVQTNGQSTENALLSCKFFIGRLCDYNDTGASFNTSTFSSIHAIEDCNVDEYILWADKARNTSTDSISVNLMTPVWGTSDRFYWFSIGASTNYKPDVFNRSAADYYFDKLSFFVRFAI